ncbi:MAG: TM2 domain-containing protein, partial [Planctomycetota bacterium]|nr:TM2 domain-containing protein [Planctomycetota bacterium]
MPETEEEQQQEEAMANGGEGEQEQMAEPQKPSRRSRRRSAEGERTATKLQHTAFILSMLLGFLGLDRLYLGYIGLAVAKILAIIFSVALLFLDTTSISPSFTPPVACAASLLLFFVALTLYMHDFILIGLGRMRDGRGAPLIGIPDAKPATCHQGWAFVLALFTGYAGGDRFYLKSSLYGGLKLALFAVGIILLLFGNPHWRGLRDYPIIYKFTAAEVREDTPGASQVLFGLRDHRLTLCAYPTEKQREEYSKANAAYFEKMAKAVKTFVPPPLGGGEARPPFGATPTAAGEAEKAAGGDADKPIAEGALTTVEVPCDGVNNAAILRAEMEKMRERMARGLLQDRNNALGHIRAHVSRWPFIFENPTVGMIAIGLLGLSLLLWLIDLLLIGCGKMKDGKGEPLGLDPA